MFVTLDGIFILVKPLHSENAPSPMLVTPNGISMLVNPLQYENTPSPILVTLELINSSQQKNAYSPMLVTSNGISMLPFLPPLLLGGGVGVPPLYLLAKTLIAEGKRPYVILGFNTKSEVFYEEEFRALGALVTVTTVDGSYGTKGFVTNALPEEYTYFYTCGPEPMLKAVWKSTVTSGQLSFEERMGCGFGACMGCSCKTLTGNKRICKEGPVMVKEEILW